MMWRGKLFEMVVRVQKAFLYDFRGMVQVT